ncbi:MAG: hypothetical protein AAGA48_19700 [Myxococcota bacterium]
MPPDELFQPTVARTQRAPGTPNPWYVTSQFWLAFFGGIFALFSIAWLNTYRLGMNNHERVRVVLWTGFAFLAVTGALWAYVAAFEGVAPSITGIRIAYRVGAVALYAALARIQRSAYRRYDYLVNSEESAFSSLWIPGIVAAVVAGVLQGFVTVAVLLPLFALPSPEAP